MKWMVLVGVLMLAPAAAQDVPRHVSTAEDCEIFAVVAKARLGWTATEPPEGSFSAEITEYDGDPAATGRPNRTFVAICPWKELGLAEPSGNSKLKWYSLGRPKYAGNGSASVLVSRTEFQDETYSTAPRVDFEVCHLSKRDSRWQIKQCAKPAGSTTVFHP
jgi:hypothetical protein